LSAVELQQLKLANALLERPRILVLSRLFDLLEPEPIERAVAELKAQAYTTVIYFSGRRIDLGFDRFLYLEAHQQRSFASFDEFAAATGIAAQGN
ncbi:MAG: ABC transporter ATP-binding protein, partial [Erythrobacter sp.]